MELTLESTWNSLEWPGADGTAAVDALREGGISDRVLIIYEWDEAAQTWMAFFPGLEHTPGLNTLTAFRTGRTYWVAATEPVTRTVVKRGAALAAADRRSLSPRRQRHHQLEGGTAYSQRRPTRLDKIENLPTGAPAAPLGRRRLLVRRCPCCSEDV